jgi:aspartate 1-decarboxylase
MENYRKVLHSKIHRATVTQADVHYEGSITIPPDLLEAASLAEYEAVNIWNVNAGTRFETYTIRGQDGTRDICVNGAAARLVAPGDLVIIASFKSIPESRLADHRPFLVFVDEHNCIKELRNEVAGPTPAPYVVGLRRA